MPNRYNRDVESTLINKFEFTSCKKQGDDHKWVELKLEGIAVIRTCFSHTKEDIGPVLWKKIANQLRVKPAFLDGMIDCSNDRDVYYKLVRENPAPLPPYMRGR
jgi:hypothetical protein